MIGMFFKKAKRIKELERQLVELQQELERSENKLAELQQEKTVTKNNYFYMNADYLNEEEPDYSEPCECGGVMFPMDDLFPNWIKFCPTCDARKENTEVSPLEVVQ